MQMVKIQIPDKGECAKAFSALIRRGGWPVVFPVRFDDR
jgi:hypothetical protein